MSTLDILEPIVSQLVIPVLSALFGAGGAFWLAKRRPRK